MLNPKLDEIQLTKEEYERYSRHLILPEVSLEGQKRLKAASVLCIGTGGLGSPLLLYLAAAGVGRIGIVDFDVVDNSNLQRQVIHGTSWVGKPKIASAKHRILEINPNCQVDCYETRLPRLRKLLRYGCPLVFSGDGDCLALVEFCTASRPSLHPGLLIRVCRSAERPESA